MEINTIEEIKSLLRGAARSKGTVSFSELFALFPSNTPSASVYDALEDAASAIASSSDAIYSAVMSKKGHGCPGDGFFDIFKIQRHTDYVRIAGTDTKTLELTEKQKKDITREERARVYAHASVNDV